MVPLVRRLTIVAATAASLVAARAAAQSLPSSTAPARDWRLSITIFRSPGTGVQLARGSFAVFAAHYPTIFDRGDGAPRRDRPTTHFLRVGVARYLRADASTSPYVSLSVAPSLTRGWSTSGLLDVGVRRRFTGTLSGQLGAAVLHTPSRRVTRLNPTLGLGVTF